MNDTTTTMTMTPPAHRNGVDRDLLFGTINAVGAQPDLAAFQFRASSTWMQGTHSRTTISTFHGAGQELEHARTMTFDADHPTVLVGSDEGPTPVEYLLVGLAGCLTAGIANVATARKITLHAVEASIEGDIDLQGILGLSADVRNGYQAVRVRFRIEADATEAQIRQIVEQSKARSAVLDVLTNGVPVDVELAG